MTNLVINSLYLANNPPQVQFSTRPVFYKAPVILTKDKDFRHASIQHQRMSTEPTHEPSYNYSNSNTQNSRMVNIQPNKTILVQNGIAYPNVKAQKTSYPQSLPKDEVLPSFKATQSSAKAINRVSWSIKPDPTRATFSNPVGNQSRTPHYRAKSSGGSQRNHRQPQQQDVLDQMAASKQIFLPKPSLEANSPIKRSTVRHQTFSQSVEAATFNNRLAEARETSKERNQRPSFTYREEHRQTPTQMQPPPDHYIAQLVEANVIKYLDKLQSSNSNFQYKSNSPMKLVKPENFERFSPDIHDNPGPMSTSRRSYHKRHTTSEVIESRINPINSTRNNINEDTSPSAMQRTVKIANVLRPQRPNLKSSILPNTEPSYYLNSTSQRDKFYSVVDDQDAGPKLYFNSVFPKNQSSKDLSPQSTKRRLIDYS